jgi:hypothetical protein
MAGRSLTACTGRWLRALPEEQSPSGCSVMLSRHGDLYLPALEVFRAKAASTALVSAVAVGIELVALLRASAGASTIACMGSGIVVCHQNSEAVRASDQSEDYEGKNEAELAAQVGGTKIPKFGMQSARKEHRNSPLYPGP